jgi:hypothetical protein
MRRKKSFPCGGQLLKKKAFLLELTTPAKWSFALQPKEANSAL